MQNSKNVNEIMMSYLKLVNLRILLSAFLHAACSKTPEASRISVLPRMAREIKVELNVSASNEDRPAVALVLKRRGKKEYTVAVPNTVVHTRILEGVKFFYRKENNSHSIWAKGPLFAELVILVVVTQRELQTGINIDYNTKFSIQKSYLEPSKRFIWIKGGWGPCSASCGGGYRQKTVACWDNLNKKIVKRNICSLVQKPKMQKETCNTFDCNFLWLAGEWEPCSASCGTSGIQSREVYCIPKSVLNTMLHGLNGTKLEPWRHMVHPKKCSQVTPTTTRPCNRIPCFSYWRFHEWSQCSASCGVGFQTRTSYCPAPSLNEQSYTCGSPPPNQKRECSADQSKHKACKEIKHKKCFDDESEYCSIDLLRKYCILSGFRRVCCKSCKNFQDVE